MRKGFPTTLLGQKVVKLEFVKRCSRRDLLPGIVRDIIISYDITMTVTSEKSLRIAILGCGRHYSIQQL